MGHVRITITLALIITLAVLPACNAKKDKPEQALPQKGSPATPPNAAVTAPPQDEADTTPLKEKVLAQLKTGDFAAIYRDASAGFREVGPEQMFLAQWNKQLQETGPFKDAKETSHSVRPTDKFLVFIYTVTNENKQKELRLTFGRSKKGKMELTGINQRDPK
jgi:hypothetical protein